jgi:hypothetical protein
MSCRTRASSTSCCTWATQPAIHTMHWTQLPKQLSHAELSDEQQRVTCCGRWVTWLCCCAEAALGPATLAAGVQMCSGLACIHRYSVSVHLEQGHSPIHGCTAPARSSTRCGCGGKCAYWQQHLTLLGCMESLTQSAGCHLPDVRPASAVALQHHSLHSLNSVSQSSYREVYRLLKSYDQHVGWWRGVGKCDLQDFL